MAKKIVIKHFLFGFLTWFIPFAISFAFYKSNKTLAVPYALFKTTMVIIACVTDCYLMFRYFRIIDKDFVKQGVLVGTSWFVINVIFDAFILIPMMRTDFNTYFTTIGLGYLVIPTISITLGFLLERKISSLR